MKSKSNKVILMTIGALSATTFAGEGTQYRVVPIPAPDNAQYFSANGLNNSNEVTGSATVASGNRPYVYSNGESLVLQDVPGTSTYATTLNDSTHVTGWMYEWGVIWPQAFVWDGNQNHPLENPSKSYSYGLGMNDYDQVVGSYYPPGGHANGNAFVCDNGQFINLGSGQASDINNAGTIVGQINRYHGDTAIWEPNGQGQWVQTILDGELATAINESGTMFVGIGPLVSYSDAAAIWTKQNAQWVRSDIGNWDPQRSRSLALDVNDAQQVVGDYQSFDGPDYGWIYENGEVTWLSDQLDANSSGWEVTRAKQINESGVILVEASYNGEKARPALLMPNELTVMGPRPGRAGQANDFISVSATPGNRVYFAYGLAEGYKKLPGCPGITVGIRAPVVFGSAVANNDQEARLSQFVPRSAADQTIFIQTVEPASCTVSNVLRYQIR